MLITILGSCRQVPVSKYCKITNILEGLNYPHYSSEILQQIRYIKYKNINEYDTQFCFRSGILSKNTISDLKYYELKRDFYDTTLFLVEIASRIAYKFNNLFLHHIAEEDKYGFVYKNNIHKYELSDEDIENDIINIRNELYPKPFILITHFATYNYGKRYNLIKLLESICLKYNIPYINQSDIVANNINILVDEPILSHYNHTGQDVVAKILYNKITEVFNTNSKIIKQVYYTSNNRVKTHTFHGFGDYIRGTMCLYQSLYNKNIILNVNFSNHNLSKLFVCNNHLSINECENVIYVFNDIPNHDYSVFENKNIFTNHILISNHISDECKNFIKKNCITPTIYFQNKLSHVYNCLQLNIPYSVIHIRIYDDATFNTQLYMNIILCIYQIKQNNPNTRFIIMSSSSIYIDQINFNFLIKTHLSRGHIGLHTTNLQECEDTMIEFMIMTTCTKIFQLSVYAWGSGFSDIVNKVYDVPIENYNISNMNVDINDFLHTYDKITNS